MENVIQFINSNRENYIERAQRFLKNFKSISSDPEKKSEMQRAAEFLMTKFSEMGFDNIKILNPEEGHPVVYAERLLIRRNQQF